MNSTCSVLPGHPFFNTKAEHHALRPFLHSLAHHAGSTAKSCCISPPATRRHPQKLPSPVVVSCILSRRRAYGVLEVHKPSNHQKTNMQYSSKTSRKGIDVYLVSCVSMDITSKAPPRSVRAASLSTNTRTYDPPAFVPRSRPDSSEFFKVKDIRPSSLRG